MLRPGSEAACLICCWCVVASCAQVYFFLGVVWSAGEPALTGILMTDANEGADTDGGRRPLFTYSMRWLMIPAVVAAAAVGVAWMCSTPRKVIFKAKRSLQPFTALNRGDVDEIEVDAPHAGALTKGKFVYGQLLAAAVPAKAILMESHLLKTAEPAKDMNGWQLYSAEAASTTPSAGEVVSLLGVKEGADKPVLITEEAVALGSDGAKVVVAVPPGCAKVAPDYLGDKGRLRAIRTLRQEWEKR